jgi:hypothetical protein
MARAAITVLPGNTTGASRVAFEAGRKFASTAEGTPRQLLQRDEQARRSSAVFIAPSTDMKFGSPNRIGILGVVPLLSNFSAVVN